MSHIVVKVALVLCLLTSCKQKQAPPPPQITAVSTITIQQQNVPAEFEYVGVAQSSHLVEIRARVEGFLDEIAYQEGQVIHEGDLMFQIDPKPFEASLAQAKAVREQREAVHWEAERTVERLKPLYEQNAASRRDLDNAIAQELATKASLEEANAQVTQAELNLGYTSIRSPITGVSSQAKYRVGSLVGPNNNNLLATVTAVDPIWVNFNVSEGDMLKYASEAHKGKLSFPEGYNYEVEIVLSNGLVIPSLGRVDFADPTLQQTTGSMIVRAVIPNPKDMLRPGQFVRVRIKGVSYTNVFLVPQKAVMRGKDGLYVYIIGKDNKVEKRAIDPGDWHGEDWIILGGLQNGDQVIVDGINKVMPGATVTIDNSPQGKPGHS